MRLLPPAFSDWFENLLARDPAASGTRKTESRRNRSCTVALISRGVPLLLEALAHVVLLLQGPGPWENQITLLAGTVLSYYAYYGLVQCPPRSVICFSCGIHGLGKKPSALVGLDPKSRAPYDRPPNF